MTVSFFKKTVQECGGVEHAFVCFFFLSVGVEGTLVYHFCKLTDLSGSFHSLSTTDRPDEQEGGLNVFLKRVGPKDVLSCSVLLHPGVTINKIERIHMNRAPWM